MEINFPKDFKSNYRGYKNFITLLHLLNDTDDNTSIINFKNTQTFEANLAAILGAIVDLSFDQDKRIEYINIPPVLKNFLELNTFLPASSSTYISKHIGTIITFMKFTPYKDIEFIEYIKNEMLSKPNFPKHSKMLGKKINESIFELFENARTHGHCKNIYTCGQIIEEDGATRLDFTIVDMGKTIKLNVNQYLDQKLSGADAIEWAIQSGHTTKTGDVSGGLGLDIIFEFIKLNKGRIQIVSSDGFLEYHNGNIKKKTFEKPFFGTIANIEFNLDDKDSYILKEEISLKNIF